MNSIRLNGCCGNPQECHWQYAPECQDDGTDKTTISAIIRPVSDRANRPEQRSMVCVFGGRNGMVWAREAQYVGDTFYAHNEEFDNYSFALPDIIYWQPLPTLLGDKMDIEELDELHKTCTADSWRTLGGLLVESYPDIKRLIEASRKLHQYLIDTDEEGLIQHAPQMEAVQDALTAIEG